MARDSRACEQFPHVAFELLDHWHLLSCVSYVPLASAKVRVLRRIACGCRQYEGGCTQDGADHGGHGALLPHC